MTLYRKYRPALFADVVGRESIITILTEELKAQRIAHAYLFSGVRGTGKTSVARIFAKALNCTARDEKTGEPCNTCEMCIAITKGTSSDIIEIDAASNRRIDEIRELREHIKYAPSLARYKVYIIDEVHMLTTEAFNALLKTLEEPPKHAVFILATTELHKIPDTIFSRCQHFSFSKLSLEIITTRLADLAKRENVEIDNELLVEIARRANGALRDAESLLGQIISIGKKKITPADAALFLPKGNIGQVLEWIGALAQHDIAQALRLLASYEEAGVHMEFFLHEALSVSRYMLLFAGTQESTQLERTFSAVEVDTIRTLVAGASVSLIRKITAELLRAHSAMKLSPDMPTLPLELAVVVICSPDVAPGVLLHQHTVPHVPDIQKKNSALVSHFTPIAEPPRPETKAETAEKKAKKIAEAETVGASNHTLEEILDGWGEVLGKVKGKSAALNFVLGVGQPTAVKGNKLEVGFKFRLQQEKVLENANREVVERVLEEVYGSRYTVDAILKDDINLINQPKVYTQQVDSVYASDNLASSPTVDDTLVNAALDVFEGATVEN